MDASVNPLTVIDNLRNRLTETTMNLVLTEVALAEAQERETALELKVMEFETSQKSEAEMAVPPKTADTEDDLDAEEPAG